MKKLLVAFIVLGAIVFALPNTANAVPIVNGSVSLTTGTYWTADIFYQVYAPNVANPSGFLFANDYSYFYRVDNVVSAHSTLKSLTVGNPGIAPIDTVNYATYLAGNNVPLAWGKASSGDSIGWQWEIFNDGSNAIKPGDHSAWCYYTTALPPGWVDGSLQNGGAAIFGPVPGPVPEPSSMALLGVGLVGLVGALRRKFMA